MNRLARWSFACVLLAAGLASAQPPAFIPPAPPPTTTTPPATTPPAKPPSADLLPPVKPDFTTIPPVPRHNDGVPAVIEAESGKPGSLLFDGEFFAWAPRRRGQDYAIYGTAPLGTPIGTIRTLEGGYDPGFRIGAAYRLPEHGWEVYGAYTYWHSAANDHITAIPPDQRVFATLTHPAFVVEVGGAAGSNSINMNVFDIELARRFELTEGAQMRLFAGPTFANLDQRFTANYSGVSVVSDTVTRKVTFDGGGLRVGGQADFEVFQHLGLFVRGSAGLMTGRMRSSLSEVGNGAIIVNVVDRFNRIVPVTDLGIGLSYEFGTWLRLSAGYEFHNWGGVVERFDFVDDAHTSKMARRADDLGFDGIFFRCHLTF
jgi:hypothetical protein